MVETPFVTAARRFNGFMRTPQRELWLLPSLLVLLIPITTSRAQDIVFDVTGLSERVAALHGRAVELAGSDDLLDTLHFGWFDRPYARATLAIALKTTAVLRREARLQEVGKGAIDDATLRTMLKWTDGALVRAAGSKAENGFRPHRLRVTPDELLDGASTLPLYAFIDRSTVTRQHDVFGDLDLLAAIGLRAYALPLSDLDDPTTADMLFDRASALGICLARVAMPERPVPDEWETPPATTNGALTMHARPLRDWLLGAAPAGRAADEGWAISEPRTGESWSASLARHALVRGVSERCRYFVADWTPPNGPDLRALAAAVWVGALDGQALGVIPGWRDLRDGSVNAAPSIFLDPAAVETVAHTSLDLLRLRAHLGAFQTTPLLAIVVGADAVDDRDEAVWASWVLPVWETLMRRQIRFDVVRLETGLIEPARRYRVVFPIRADEASDATALVARVERTLAVESEHLHRITAREEDGSLAADVYIRSGRASDEKPCVAVVNLSSESRRLKLRGGPSLGAVRDVVANESIAAPAERLPMGPWQVRILWAAK